MSLSALDDITSDPSDYSDLESSNETATELWIENTNNKIERIPLLTNALSIDYKIEEMNENMNPPSKRTSLEAESLDCLLAKAMTVQPNLRWDVDDEWCRFCGARASTSFFTSPWGHRQLCFKHHTMWKQNKIDLIMFDEPQNIESVINKSQCTEKQYLIDLLMKYDNIDIYQRRSLRMRPKKLKIEEMTYFGSDSDSSYGTATASSSSYSSYSSSDSSPSFIDIKPKRKQRRKRLFKLYSCKDCDETFESPKLFKLHCADIHNNNRAFECIECEKCYVDAGNLDYHIRKIHEKEINYHCSFCNKPFFDKTEWKKHTQTHTKKKVINTKKKFICNHCNRRFKYRYYLKKHIINIHMANKDKPYQCSYCAYGAATKWQISIHEDIHRNERQYKCPHCNRGFNNKKNCEHHVLNTHVKPFKCVQCNKGFGSVKYLESHIMNVHTKHRDKAFHCRYCAYGAAKKQTVQKHELLHCNDDPFRCDQCGKSFKLLSYLHTHMDRVHVENKDKKYKCSICHKKFQHKRYLKYHIQSHSQNDINYYECDKCEYSTPHKQRLEKHKEIHSGEKPFECDICGKRFRLNQYVKSHKMNMHNREKTNQ